MLMKIDLNSDLGEHPDSNLDEQIMPYISSCNIACGGHVGDADSVRKTIELAIKNKVAIGAHPSFPDKKNFGREVMQMELSELKKSLKEQILLVKSIAHEMGTELHHVKPHGALYNYAAVDNAISEMICELILELSPELKLYSLAHSEAETVANKMNVVFIGEAFADRKYEMNRTLRSRKKSDAVLVHEQEVLSQVEELVCNGRVKSEDWISIAAQTICLHSDTLGAVHLAKAIRNHLEQKGVHIVAV
jgi:5-oxoprolinase (ATP-hydrolysing) subunit A